MPKANGKYPFWGVNDDLRCVYGVIETGLYGKKIEVVNKDNPTAPLFEADDKLPKAVYRCDGSRPFPHSIDSR